MPAHPLCDAEAQANQQQSRASLRSLTLRTSISSSSTLPPSLTTTTTTTTATTATTAATAAIEAARRKKQLQQEGDLLRLNSKTTLRFGIPKQSQNEKQQYYHFKTLYEILLSPVITKTIDASNNSHPLSILTYLQNFTVAFNSFHSLLLLLSRFSISANLQASLLQHSIYPFLHHNANIYSNHHLNPKDFIALHFIKAVFSCPTRIPYDLRYAVTTNFTPEKFERIALITSIGSFHSVFISLLGIVKHLNVNNQLEQYHDDIHKIIEEEQDEEEENDNIMDDDDDENDSDTHSNRKSSILTLNDGLEHLQHMNSIRKREISNSFLTSPSQISAASSSSFPSCSPFSTSLCSPPSIRSMTTTTTTTNTTNVTATTATTNTTKKLKQKQKYKQHNHKRTSSKNVNNLTELVKLRLSMYASNQIQKSKWLRNIPNNKIQQLQYIQKLMGFVPNYLKNITSTMQRSIFIYIIRDVLLTSNSNISILIKNLICFLLSKTNENPVLTSHFAYLANEKGAAENRHLLVSMDSNYIRTVYHAFSNQRKKRKEQQQRQKQQQDKSQVDQCKHEQSRLLSSTISLNGNKKTPRRKRTRIFSDLTKKFGKMGNNVEKLRIRANQIDELTDSDSASSGCSTSSSTCDQNESENNTENTSSTVITEDEETIKSDDSNDALTDSHSGTNINKRGNATGTIVMMGATFDVSEDDPAVPDVNGLNAIEDGDFNDELQSSPSPASTNNSLDRNVNYNINRNSARNYSTGSMNRRSNTSRCISSILSDEMYGGLEDMYEEDYFNENNEMLSSASLCTEQTNNGEIDNDHDKGDEMLISSSIFNEKEVTILVLIHEISSIWRSNNMSSINNDGQQSSEELNQLLPKELIEDIHEIFTNEEIIEIISTIATFNLLDKWTICCDQRPGSGGLEKPVRQFIKSDLGKKLGIANIGQRYNSSQFSECLRGECRSLKIPKHAVVTPPFFQ